MPTSPQEPQHEHPSTYFVQDRSNLDELQRLAAQDQMFTKGMGGVLPEQPDPARFERILDVGCGTGGWLIETAKRYPTIRRLIGVDISNTMLAYARQQAEAQQVANRVEFRAMDALRMLEFPTDFFDLVNQRLGVSYLRKWDWPKLLHEFWRVCRPGGVIRLVEAEIGDSNSPALTQLFQLLLQALWQAGHLFYPEHRGIATDIAPLLERHGLQQVQERVHILEYRGGTPEGQLFAEDGRRGFRTQLPFLQKWTRIPDNYEELYQQALHDMEQPKFLATWRMMVAWGNTPL